MAYILVQPLYHLSDEPPTTNLTEFDSLDDALRALVRTDDWYDGDHAIIEGRVVPVQTYADRRDEIVRERREQKRQEQEKERGWQRQQATRAEYATYLELKAKWEGQPQPD